MLLVGASEAQETGEEANKVVVDESPVAAAKESNDGIEKLISKREIDDDEIFRDQLEQTLMEKEMIQDQLIEELLMEPRWWKGERRGRWGRRRWGGRRRGERRGGYYSDEEDEDQMELDQIIEEILMDARQRRGERRDSMIRRKGGKQGVIKEDVAKIPDESCNCKLGCTCVFQCSTITDPALNTNCINKCMAAGACPTL